MLVQELINYSKQYADNRKIEDIRVGIGYIVVLLNDGSCGTSFTFRGELGPKCGQLDEAGNLIGKKANELIEWAMDINLIKAGIGVAVINAVLQKYVKDYKQEDAIEVIDIKEGDTLGMIGYYKPVLEAKKELAKNIYIFERNITDHDLLYPDWSEDIYLPKCDVVIISGTTLINKTIDHILEKCENAHEIAVIGPTTSPCPEVFKKHGVTLLASSLVKDSKKVLNIASQGGGGINIKDYVKQICYKL
mgnify:CR=1 FL=1